MTVRQPRYSKEEFAQRGDEIYENQVRPQDVEFEEICCGLNICVEYAPER